MTEINEPQPETGRDLKRRGKGFVPKSQLLRGGDVDVRSINLQEVNFSDFDVGLVGQIILNDDAFGLGLKRMSLNGLGSFIEVIGIPTPSQTNTYDLGTTGRRWATLRVVNVDESSDETLKENIKNLPYGLKEVLKLNPIIYKWKNKEGENLGFSAQKVKEILPEISEDGTSLKTTQMIPVLVKAIQELTEKLNKLENEIKSNQE